MDLPDRLQCLFHGRIEQRDGAYCIEVPDQEIELGPLEADGVYRVALLPAAPADDDPGSDRAGRSRDRGGDGGRDRGGDGGRDRSGHADRDSHPPDPPVTEGDQRDVEIESLGDQGDGIARVERGFVLIVPDTEPGERVTVEVTGVQETVAFAEVVERSSCYE